MNNTDKDKLLQSRAYAAQQELNLNLQKQSAKASYKEKSLGMALNLNQFKTGDGDANGLIEEAKLIEQYLTEGFDDIQVPKVENPRESSIVTI
jgi:hypothetical protein